MNSWKSVYLTNPTGGMNDFFVQNLRKFEQALRPFKKELK